MTHEDRQTCIRSRSGASHSRTRSIGYYHHYTSDTIKMCSTDLPLSGDKENIVTLRKEWHEHTPYGQLVSRYRLISLRASIDRFHVQVGQTGSIP